MAVNVREAVAADVGKIADLYLIARREAMPYLNPVRSDEETRAWFHRRTAADSFGVWWVVEQTERIVGYMVLHGAALDDLYVLPICQGRGIGSLLLAHAKSRSPRRLELCTFQRNLRARTFYEAHQFQPINFTDGSHNEEGEPDVQYEWQAG